MHQNRLSVSWWPGWACYASGSGEVSGRRKCTERRTGGRTTSGSDLQSVWSVRVTVIESGGSRDERPETRAGPTVGSRKTAWSPSTIS